MSRGVPLLVIREHFDMFTQLTSIEIGTIAHSNHGLTRELTKRPGMPKYTQSVVLDSPSKLLIAQTRFVASASAGKGFNVNSKPSTAVKSRLHPRIQCPRASNGGLLLICTIERELLQISTCILCTFSVLSAMLKLGHLLLC